jgi:hypothetical protein
MLKVSLLISLMLFLFSCGDKKVYDVYLIENKSNESILISYEEKEIYNNQQIKNMIYVEVAPQTEKVFYTGSSSTLCPINENDDYLLCFDTLQIKPKNGKLRLDFRNIKNWSYRKDWSGFRKCKTYFKFQIENKDIAK